MRRKWMGSDRKGSWFWNKWNCKKSFHQSSNKVCETKEDLKKLRKVWHRCGKSNESRKDMRERHFLVWLDNFVNERNIKSNYNIKSHCLPDIQQRFAYHLLHLFNVAYPLYQKILCWSTSTLRLYQEHEHKMIIKLPKTFDMLHLEYLIARKKVDIKFRRYKKSSLKNFATGKIIHHILPTNFFAWLSEYINWFLLSWSFIILLSFKSFNRMYLRVFF